MEELAQKDFPPDEADNAKGLSHFLDSPEQREIQPPPSFGQRVSRAMGDLPKHLLVYLGTPDFRIWLRNWLQVNIFYLLPASFAPPLMTYIVRFSPQRLQYLVYGTLDTLWKANLLSLALVLVIGAIRSLLQSDKVEVKRNPHPFRRLFWYWIGANFIYVLPIILYGTLYYAWYALDGMEGKRIVIFGTAMLWSIATFFSLSILLVSGMIAYVFQGFRPPLENDNSAD